MHPSILTLCPLKRNGGRLEDRSFPWGIVASEATAVNLWWHALRGWGFNRSQLQFCVHMSASKHQLRDFVTQNFSSFFDVKNPGKQPEAYDGIVPCISAATVRTLCSRNPLTLEAIRQNPNLSKPRSWVWKIQITWLKGCRTQICRNLTNGAKLLNTSTNAWDPFSRVSAVSWSCWPLQVSGSRRYSKRMGLMAQWKIQWCRSTA